MTDIIMESAFDGVELGRKVCGGPAIREKQKAATKKAAKKNRKIKIAREKLLRARQRPQAQQSTEEWKPAGTTPQNGPVASTGQDYCQSLQVSSPVPVTED